MHDLVPLTALGGDSAQSETIKSVTISEMPDCAYASMAMRLGRKTGFQRAAKKATGILPPPPGESAVIKTGRGLLTVFWTGVDQWMVEAPHASHADLAAQLSGTLKDNGSVTEQNDGWARFDLKGDNCVAVLERLSAADSASMQAGATTRTTIEHLGCFLLCRKAATHFSVICPRSGAASMYHALVTMAQSAL